MKESSINRQQFLRGHFSAEQALRPPWALVETRFIDTCTRCGECISNCPVDLIQLGSGGFPEINFKHNGCDYCAACATACKPNALIQSKNKPAFPDNQLAVINDKCFAQRGIICRSCGEICEFQAIEFKLLVGGSAQLKLNTTLCDGCGECVHVCPADAIQIKKSNMNNALMESNYE